ncbi:MAG: MmgE/PrpD family protein [Chloroflexota bacterium]|nr:MmgE/PrpD family protein [Chloroflexota bacterium]
MNVTKYISKFVMEAKLEQFSAEAIEAAKGAIIDSFACMLAGCKEDLADVLCRHIITEGGHPCSTVIGRGIKTTSLNAAMVNGSMAHALDYDDITQVSKTHPTAVLLPAVLALSEEYSCSGADLLLSYMVGFEVACSVSESLSNDYYDDLGWHPTGPLGCVGSGVASAKLLKLNSQQISMTTSLAASQASGLRQNFGSMTKPFHAGSAARSGVLSAKLVSDGFTAAHDAIEGRFGFSRAFSGGRNFNPEIVLDNLGVKSYLTESGIEIKKYPCCGSAHVALDAIFDLLKREDINYEDVGSINVMVDFDPPRSLVHSRPTTGLEGKFSMEYCLSAALLDRHIGFDSFTDEKIMRLEVQDLICKIAMKRIPGNEGRPSWLEGYNELEIIMRNGNVFSSKSYRPTTGALRGVTLDEIHQKFLDCSQDSLRVEKSKAVLSMLDNLESADSLAEMLSILIC